MASECGCKNAKLVKLLSPHLIKDLNNVSFWFKKVNISKKQQYNMRQLLSLITGKDKKLTAKDIASIRYPELVDYCHFSEEQIAKWRILHDIYLE